MRSVVLKFIILTGMLLGLPMLGVVLAGYPMAPGIWSFPLKPGMFAMHPFHGLSSPLTSFSILAVVFPFIIKSILRIRRKLKSNRCSLYTFPWWGWLGIITGAVSWILAWTRFPWFEPYQAHTFTPLWFSFILVINALCHRRTGHCMMIDRTRFFVLCFFP